MSKTFAILSFKVEGLHHWPEAEGNEAYLKYPHRHMFHYLIKIEQFHNNRDVEYLEWRRKLNYVFECSLNRKNEVQDFGSKSCETLANECLNYIKEHPEFDKRSIVVSVFEDGENGAEVTYTPDA